MNRSATTIKRSILILGVLATIPTIGFSQTEEELRKMEEEQRKWMEDREKDFRDFVEQRDKEYADLLKKQWEEMQQMTALKSPDKKPKPVQPPVVAEEKPEKLPAVKVPVLKPDALTTNIPQHEAMPNVPELEEPDDVHEEKPELDLTTTVDFYGMSFEVPYNNALVVDIDKVDNKTIGEHWLKLSAANYHPFLETMLRKKKDMQLNDWGYYMLLNSEAQRIYAKDQSNEVKLFVWFMLNKTGYRAKVGYAENTVYLLLPFKGRVYSKPYYKIDGINYFQMEKVEGKLKLKVHKGDYPKADMLFDLNVYKPMILGDESNEVRNLEFNYGGEKHLIPMVYNTKLMEYYDAVPHTDLEVYFGAAVSHEVREGIAEHLAPLVEGKSELEAVNLLLNFVQTSFEYQTDGEQFGKEKYFYPEELFYYKYCDCEDRSVLFAYLVRELLGLKVVGLDYPGHIATAVQFNEEVEGDYIELEEGKYIISDPTYINAPVGMCMPNYKGEAAKIITLN